ncbi:MAG: hypothetical protein OEW64_11285 [Gammaproteobacteria bacterium]|nr:hypothetical protein [Gammaproteobacteria bacterium]
MKTLQGLVLACAFALFITPAGAEQLHVGAAKRDTTPKSEWLPLYGVARSKLVAVIDPIHVRVIALSNGAQPSLIVTFEAGGPPDAASFLTGLSQHTGIPVDAIYYGGTHAHTSPGVVADAAVPGSKPYVDFVYQQMLDAADEAIARLRPATVGIGYSNSYINTNRQRFYELEDGSMLGAQGYNPTGPSDKTLSVIRFADLQGKPIAFIVHYAMHLTSMYANKFNDEGTGISGDVGGAVSGHLERRFEGAIANWIPGAAGDQNPILSNEYFTPNPETGAQEIQMMGRAVVELMEFYGKIQFADVLTALENLEFDTGDARVSYAKGLSSLPPYAEGQPEAVIGLSLMRIGDIALVGTSGELFNSIGVYMQDHSLLQHTLVSNQVRTVVTGSEPISGYQPDDYAVVHDGWHTNNRRYAVGSVDGGYTRLMNQLIESTNK